MEIQVEEIIDALRELHEDTSVPKNIKLRLSNTIGILGEEKDLSTKKNKALNELEDVTDDANLEAYPRTRLYTIISLLETM